MPDVRAPRKKKQKLTSRIHLITRLVISVLAVGLIAVMAVFMNTLTDTILMETLQPMAKTATQSVEEYLHTLSKSFFELRDNDVITSSTAASADKGQVLSDFAAGAEFTWLGLYFPTGVKLVGTNNALTSVSTRSLFGLIKDTDNFAIEDTAIASGGLEIVMGLPVTLEGDGSTVYLIGAYDYQLLGDVLRKIHVSTNGLAFIVNETGRFVAHGDTGKIVSRGNVFDSLGTSEAANAAFRAMTEGQTGAMDIRGDQGRVLISFSPIHGTLWSLGIQAPRADYVSATNQALIIAAFIAAAFLLSFSLFFTLFIRNTLSVPLKAITDNADKLANGDFENLIYPDTLARQDEIGQFGAAFLSASHSVQNLLGDIDRLTKSAKGGALSERSDVAPYPGDYRHILSGINTTLDVFCSHLDIMPEALMFFDQSRRCLYRNKAMTALLERQGLNAADPGILAALMPPYAADGLPSEATALFVPHGDGESFQTDVELTDINGGEERNYNLSLWRV
ncbi:MAG: hypothetical protein LBS99_07145, partial [Clostridiales bacterium]|nr:hypothetical protein [Clostridiales bacterium]